MSFRFFYSHYGNLTTCCIFTFMQMAVDISDVSAGIADPWPTVLALVREDGDVGEVYLVVEGVNFGRVEDKEIPIAHLAAFYAFNITYPKAIIFFRIYC